MTMLSALLAITLLAVAITGIAPHDRATWLFELLPGVVFVVILAITAKRLRLTPLFYGVVAVQILVLAIGAQYTYALAPPGAWLREWLGLDRNPFDRVGHFLQGCTPALLVRELLIRSAGCRRGLLLSAVCIAAALGFSALYEILEWAMVVIWYPEQGAEWLGMQGDPWDAQADMLMALLGASATVLLLARWHDAQLADAEIKTEVTSLADVGAPHSH